MMRSPGKIPGIGEHKTVIWSLGLGITGFAV